MKIAKVLVFQKKDLKFENIVKIHAGYQTKENLNANRNIRTTKARIYAFAIEPVVSFETYIDDCKC